MSMPILYSFRRCPYAMRARLAIVMSGIPVELREVVLRQKPAQLLELSPKGTVPVLQTPTGEVIDESLDIMKWALVQHDPDNWYQNLTDDEASSCQTLIAQNDGEFKYYLDRYKYADRYPEHDQTYYREHAEKTLTILENKLTEHQYLIKTHITYADMAIAPFVRQFAFADLEWFQQSDYPKLRTWLNEFIESERFNAIMDKYAPWDEDHERILFPSKNSH